MSRPNWRVATACEIGTSHVSSGTPCQDHAAHAVIATNQGQVLTAVVCDGAGSAAHSEIGSWLASTTFVELAEVFFEQGGDIDDIDRALIANWIYQTAKRLADRAEQDGNSAKDYSCTLLAAIVGPNLAAFAQIGDGAIVVSHGQEDGWNWVFWPERGEYVNQTTFILSENAIDDMQFDLAPRRIDELALFSDGIERMVLHGSTRTVNDDFFNQMFKPLRMSRSRGIDTKLSNHLKNYLGSPIINAKTDDDKTLFMATRNSNSEFDP